MEQGQFYFISDEFYRVHDKDCALMQNKETVEGTERGRPCFFAFQDNKTPGIFWCVPISSKTNKYKAIFDRKLDNQRERGILNPKCNTICLGDVMGLPRAFLIQNMFPIIEKYIASVYIDRNTQTPVTIEPETERLVINNAKDVLRLVNRGHKNLVFSDITKTYADLIIELAQ
ncbi:MAG: hypothetical protein LBL83_12710 [Clostridiales bacterium]|jgi:hypothetical protein|nr:hypothetical protein [Clostridiales bacterium]